MKWQAKMNEMKELREFLWFWVFYLKFRWIVNYDAWGDVRFFKCVREISEEAGRIEKMNWGQLRAMLWSCDWTGSLIAHIYCLQQRSSMTRAKKIVEATKKVSASKVSNTIKKIIWVRNDNCCLLYAMWETLTKQQQELLTVSDCKAVVGQFLLF